ncbi:MAG: AgmX/PglI C-terminal domain-containing protein [Deltaproteobacteria bacterium]|nr:AgmX/PglI C-terminal domain-containing protein [Deltaproteobacteria bacterium]
MRRDPHRVAAALLTAGLVLGARPLDAATPAAPREATEQNLTSVNTDARTPAPAEIAPPGDTPPPLVRPTAPTMPPPTPRILLEEPYKMGERVGPRTREAYRQEIRELRHWSAGGTGTLLEALPGPEGHPDPRVTINVERVKGPHRPDELQRNARRNHWIQVIRCYRLGAYKDPELRGWTKAVIGISRAGAVRKTRLLETKLADQEVAECIVAKLAKLKFGKASAASTAWLELRVSPGDEPMPPPEDRLVPGDGQLPVAAMESGVRAGLPAFEACYRDALVRAPELWGRIVLRFHLTARGKLDEVFQSGTAFPDPRVAQCVVRAARSLSFPKPQGGDLRFLVGLRLSSDRSEHELGQTPDPTRHSP